MIIRPVCGEDVSRVTALTQQLGYGTITEAVIVQHIDRIIKATHDFVDVAVEQDRVVGYVVLHLVPIFHQPGYIATITALVVEEQLRSQGIGQALLQHIEQKAKALGVIKLEVLSNKRREDAHRFYRQNGYEERSHCFVKILNPNAHYY